MKAGDLVVQGRTLFLRPILLGAGEMSKESYSSGCLSDANTMRVPIVMIIGPPRSGTTLLGNLLDLHPRISTIIEPYYIWDHHFREYPHDQMSEKDASDPVRRRIRGSFGRYLTDIGADMVVDKSPRNSIKIPFIKAVFPEAYFVIIMRDPRDTILSIQRQWQSVGAAFSNYRHKKLLKEFLFD